MKKKGEIWLMLLVLGFYGCKKSDKGGDNAAEAGNPAEVDHPAEQKSILGTWSLDNIELEKATDQAMVYSGSAKLTLRANNTFYMMNEGVTLNGAGKDFLKSCTNYMSGKFRIENDSLILTDRAVAQIGGYCGSDRLDTIFVSELPILTMKFKHENDELKLFNIYTYLDAQGNSVADSAIQRYKNHVAEDWDGKGLDPRFEGKFRLSKIYGSEECKTFRPESYKYAFKGQESIEIGAEVKVSLKDFSLMSDEKCTGTGLGTMNVETLFNKINVTSSSDACVSEHYKDSGDVTTFVERDLAFSGSHLVSFVKMQVGNDACREGVFKGGIITVYERAE